MTEFINAIDKWLAQYPLLNENIKFFGILLLALSVYVVTRMICLKYVAKLVRKTSVDWDEIILNEGLLKRISCIPPILVLRQFIHLLPDALTSIGKILDSVVVLLILLIIGSLIDSVIRLIERIPRFRDRPVKGYIQIVKIIVYIFGGILIIGILTAKEIWTLITGLGALTAIIILIFKDTILSFVASLQISSYDLVKEGDWIEVPKYGADGDVIDIALHTVKVQNWDKTITVIPTYKLIEESFKNWRGMQETGGRRIARSIYIDLSSVKFLDDDLYERLSRINSLSEYLKNKKQEIDEYNNKHHVDVTVPVNGRRLTNLGTFRAYLKEYLKRREDLNTNLTFLVRHLSPGPTGLPIEIYVFAGTTRWADYEDIQSDIFDHIFAVVPHFELRIFQNPTGNDFKALAYGRKREEPETGKET
ncbi:MAG TPA: mechanosensitive ion channel [bacterium]|nr:mechanosensitive ion channel [bacterium]